MVVKKNINHIKSAIDLYSGIGGWTLGMKLSGVKNIASFEWWKEANLTHNLNFETKNEEINIRDIDVKSDLKFDANIDFVVGSPPCTQFSYANKGGNGNVQDGLLDIYKFLEVVEFLKPQYWAMENVPRVAKILEIELNGGCLNRFKKLIKVIKIVNTADYGVPQNRKRMIAGDFPVSLFESYKSKIKVVTLGDVLNSLNKKIIVDPNYKYEIPRDDVTELDNEVDLTLDEVRINKDSKTFHPVYNKMAFPDKLDRPGRTITATCTRVSRESIIIESNNGFRRLNVRERGVLQGFPITYQFYGRTLSSKFKMIGNAVPPILSYYIFQCMLDVKANDIKPPKESPYFHKKPSCNADKPNLGFPKKKYPANRKFQFSVPNLRYGSGVRFELSNNPKTKSKDWSFKFFYGNSKNIKQIPLDEKLINYLSPFLNTSIIEIFTVCIEKIIKQYENISSSKMQEFWISINDNNEVFQFLDHVGNCVNEITNDASLHEIKSDLIEKIVNERNKKLNENKESIFVGFYFLSILNKRIFKQ